MKDKKYLERVQEINKDDLIQKLGEALEPIGFTFDYVSPASIFIYFKDINKWTITISLVGGDVMVENKYNESTFLNPYMITAIAQVNKIMQHWIHTEVEEQ